MSKSRAILQGIANNLSQMAMGERLSHADLETLAGLPDGRLDLDLLARTAGHSSGTPIHLGIVAHLADWLVQRLRPVPDARLRRAVLIVTLRTDRVPVDRTRVVPFDWHCEAVLEPQDGDAITGHGHGLTWHDRDRLMQ